MLFWKRKSKQKPEPPRADASSSEENLSPAELEQLMLDAVNDDRVAQYKLGQYFLGIGRELDAMNYFRYSAYRGYEPAWLGIGTMCGKEAGVPGTHEDVANWYRTAADGGCPTAQLALAGLYREGLGVEPDPVECTRLYRLAAEQGDLEAQYTLGERYLSGTGVRQDLEENVEWLQRAAERGHSFARVQLGTRYLYGVLAQQDFDRGVRMLTETADLGDLDAITILAGAYIANEGHRENHREAAKWLQRFISHSTAQSAHRHAKRLVSLAQPPSPTNVSFELLAHTLFSLIAEAGYSSGRNERRRLQGRMSSGELRKARAVTKLCLQAARRQWGANRKRKGR